MSEPLGPLDFTPEEQAIIDESLAKIRDVLKSRNISIKNVIGLATATDEENTKTAVEVRFAEETVLNVQMNMVAFD
jgi:hypothetical protein